MPLRVLQMTADRAVAQEFVVLLAGNQAGGKQLFDSRWTHVPPFTFGKSLAQEPEIGKGVHRAHAAVLQLVAQSIEIETGFEMMHTRLQKTLAMETDPEADGPEPGSGRKFVGGEINLCFLRHQIDIGEHNDAGD